MTKGMSRGEEVFPLAAIASLICMQMQQGNVAAVDGCTPACTRAGSCTVVQSIVLLFKDVHK